MLILHTSKHACSPVLDHSNGPSSAASSTTLPLAIPALPVSWTACSPSPLWQTPHPHPAGPLSAPPPSRHASPSRHPEFCFAENADRVWDTQAACHCPAVYADPCLPDDITEILTPFPPLQLPSATYGTVPDTHSWASFLLKVTSVKR